MKRALSRLWKQDNILPVVALATLLVHVCAIFTLAVWVHGSHQDSLKRGAVEIAGESLDSLALSIGAYDATAQARVETALKNFNGKGNWDALRLVARDGEIICSINGDEAGTQHLQAAEFQSCWPSKLDIHWEDTGDRHLERVTLRSPLIKGMNHREVLLEGVLRPQRIFESLSLINRPMVVIVVLSTALIYVLFRMLGKHLRPLASISSNLVRNRNNLQQELSSLRLVDERTAVARAWNQLLVLCEELRDASDPAGAYGQLDSAISRTITDDFLDAAGVIPEGIVHIVEGSHVRYINAMAERLLGLKSGADSTHMARQIDLSSAALSPVGQRIVEAISSSKTVKGFESKTVNVQSENENTYRVRVLPVMNKQHGQDAVIMISDISQLAKAEKAREDFVTHVAHELRTPLTNIQAYTETLGELDDPQIQAECFNVINAETRRLGRLVEEMLSCAQMDLGTIRVRRDDVDLLSMLHEAVRDQKAAAESKGVALTEDLPSKLPKLHADRDKLAVVVNNLLGNALKYTNTGGQVTLRCTTAEGRVRIAFIDTGIGIAKEDHLKIFERMYRVQSEEVLHQRGSGIGLATANEIVRAHGGEIDLQSELGEGSTFTVVLPLSKRAPAGSASALAGSENKELRR